MKLESPHESISIDQCWGDARLHEILMKVARRRTKTIADVIQSNFFMWWNSPQANWGRKSRAEEEGRMFVKIVAASRAKRRTSNM
jgi:hypothetical protein